MNMYTTTCLNVINGYLAELMNLVLLVNREYFYPKVKQRIGCYLYMYIHVCMLSVQKRKHKVMMKI